MKLWFVIRSFGVNGIREKIKNHIQWAQQLAELVRKSSDFVLHEPQNLSLVCFRVRQELENDQEKRNALSKKLLDRINGSGKIPILFFGFTSETFNPEPLQRFEQKATGRFLPFSL